MFHTCLNCCLKDCYGQNNVNPTKELWRLRVNFFALVALLFVSTGRVSPLASLHQFVINPTLEEQNGTQMVLPGLGQSEFFYSWVVNAHSIGEVIFSLVYACLFHVVPYTYIFLSLIMSYMLGSLLYAVASQGWMILVSRFLDGGSSVIAQVAFYVYVADREVDYETAYYATQDCMEDAVSSNKQRKLKEKMYAYRALAIGTAELIGTGISTLAAHVGGATQFHWIGWYNMTIGGALLIVLIALFRGECVWKKPEMKCTTTKCSSMKSNKTQALTGSVVLGFFILATYVTDSSYGVVETIFNPILSDYFGFTEKEISYFFVGLILVYVASSLLLMIIQELKIDNRIIAMLGITASIVGAALIADWQAIGHDSCSQFSLFHHPDLANKFKAICPDNYNLINLEAHNNTRGSYIPCSNVTLLRTVCESLGDTKYHCYWNQHSRVTGEECYACPSICRSEYKSLYLAQFGVGAVLFEVGVGVTRTALMIVIANNLSKGIRGVFMGIINAMGGLSRIVTPIWIDIAYEAMGKRTFLAMGVMVGCSLLVLVGFIGLYTKIGPQKDTGDQSTGHKTERDSEDSGIVNESTSLIEEFEQHHTE